jgi:iron complex outermembrane receptor protein
VARSDFWANDFNDADAHVSGGGQLNLRVRHRSMWGSLRAEVWAGVDNLTDNTAVGSVIVNQAAKQFFEPGLPRNWMTGVKVFVPL